MTSQIAGVLWEYPPGGCGLSEIEVPVLAYSTLTQYRTWAMQSFLFYEALANAAYLKGFGARMITLYQLFHPSHQGNGKDAVVMRARDSANDHYKKWEAISDLDTTILAMENKQGPFYDKLKAAKWEADVNGSDGHWQRALHAISHNSEDFQLKWGYKHQAPVIDTDIAMGFLMELVRAKGAILETREIKQDLHLQERELMDDFKANIIANASGLGARVLANDNQVFPVRGAVRRMALRAKTATEGSTTPPASTPPANTGPITENNPKENPEEEDPKKDSKENPEKGPGESPEDSKGKSQQPTQEDPLVNLQEMTKRINCLKDNAVLLPAQYNVNNHPSKTIFIVPATRTPWWWDPLSSATIGISASP